MNWRAEGGPGSACRTLGRLDSPSPTGQNRGIEPATGLKVEDALATHLAAFVKHGVEAMPAPGHPKDYFLSDDDDGSTTTDGAVTLPTSRAWTR